MACTLWVADWQHQQELMRHVVLVQQLSQKRECLPA